VEHWQVDASHGRARLGLALVHHDPHALEEVFKVTLPMERVLQLSNVGELTDLVGELQAGC